MGSEHEQLFLHTEVRWLSRGNVLTRFFELADEVRILLCDGTHKKFILREKLNDFSWLCKIAYLADLFTHLNVLNLKLQGPDTNIFVVEDKIEAMIEKLKLWVNRVERKSYTSLPVLQQFLTKSEDNLPVEVQDMIVEHMTDLASGLRKYVPAPDKNSDWMRHPFKQQDVASLTILSENEQDQLVDLSCSRAWEIIFKEENDLCHFWFLARSEFTDLANKALKQFVPFCTTNLCEQTFSTLCNVKSVKRNRLKNVEPALRLKISIIVPKTSDIIKFEKQMHSSH
jgi:hypothetical protein